MDLELHVLEFVSCAVSGIWVDGREASLLALLAGGGNRSDSGQADKRQRLSFFYFKMDTSLLLQTFI